MSEAEPGIHCVRGDGTGAVLVHRHAGGDYGLLDIPELFALGTIVEDARGRERIRLAAREIRELKVLADAYSFDFEEGLIELCLDLHRFAIARGDGEFELVQDPG